MSSLISCLLAFNTLLAINFSDIWKNIVDYVNANTKLVIIIAAVVVVAIIVIIVMCVAISKKKKKKKSKKSKYADTYRSKKSNASIVNDEKKLTKAEREAAKNKFLTKSAKNHVDEDDEYEDNSDSGYVKFGSTAPLASEDDGTAYDDEVSPFVADDEVVPVTEEVVAIPVEKEVVATSDKEDKAEETATPESTPVKRRGRPKKVETTETADKEVVKEEPKTKSAVASEDSTVDKKYAGKWVISEEDGRFSATLLASNEQILLRSESYSALSGVKNAIETIKNNVLADNFAISPDKNGHFFFKLFSASNRLLCVGESYASRSTCESAVESVKRFSQTAYIVKASDEVEKEEPKKEDVKATATTDEAKPAAGKRGRPKKTETVETEPVEEKKEEVKATATTDEVKPASGKRGRPKKTETVETEPIEEKKEEVKATATTDEVKPGAGKRGRPKKTETVKTEPVEEKKEEVKATATTDEAKPTTGKRGRPKKS